MNKGIKTDISSSTIKHIAYTTMLIDHFAALIYANIYGKTETYILLRNIGRIAFPLFCFMIVEGSKNTTNKINYLYRLIILYVISIIPYSYANTGSININNGNNVILTLILGLISIEVANSMKFNNIEKYSIFLICCLLAFGLKSDYGASGVIAIYALNKLKDNRILQVIIGYLAFIIRYSSLNAIELIMRTDYNFSYLFIKSFKAEYLSFIGYTIILFYNNKKGIQANKWIYYIIYPLQYIIYGYIRFHLI